MATILAAFRDGWTRVGRAPVILSGVFLLTLAAVVPFGLVMEQSIAAGLGNSIDAQTGGTALPKAPPASIGPSRRPSSGSRRSSTM
jgi:hypothetical protein